MNKFEELLLFNVFIWIVCAAVSVKQKDFTGIIVAGVLTALCGCRALFAKKLFEK